MEALHFGSAGRALLVFPTSMGRFYQWEDFGMVADMAGRIESGELQLWCVDSVDGESWYARDRPPAERVQRHLQYERYLLDELMPGLGGPPLAVGTSFGALHAVLLALRHPTRVSGFVGASGAYDTARWLDGYSDGEAYYNNPLAFVPGLADEAYLGPIRTMEPRVIVTGTEDPNVGDSRTLGEQMQAIGIEVRLELWPGWNHDWPYWKEMMRCYV